MSFRNVPVPLTREIEGEKHEAEPARAGVPLRPEVWRTLDRHRLNPPRLGRLRASAHAAEGAFLRGDAALGRAHMTIAFGEIEKIPAAYRSVRRILHALLEDLEVSFMESPDVEAPCHAAIEPLTAIVALLGPRFVGRKIAAQYGGSCAVCGGSCAKFEMILYDDATKKGAHLDCGELAPQ